MKISIKIAFLVFVAFVFAAKSFNAGVFASGIQDFNKNESYIYQGQIKQHAATNSENNIKTIKIYLENEHYTDAMLELNRLLEIKRNDPRIYIMSAELLRKTYQFDEAEKMAKKALMLDYKNSNAYLELGYVYFDKARMSSTSQETEENLEEYLTKSFDHFFMASQYDLSNPLPHVALAEAYYANRQNQKAKEEILKAKELCFNHPDAYYQIGNYYYKTKDYDKAKKFIKKSVELGNNKNHKAYYLVGRISEEEGNFKEAQQQYLQTLRLKPDMLEAQKHLDTLIKTSYKEKISEETSPKDLFANVDENLNLLMKADYFLMIDEFTKARELYVKLLEKNPKNISAAAGLAELYYSQWKEGFSVSNNFTADALYIIKSEPDKKNKIAFLKFKLINEVKIPENIRQNLINLSISETFEFYDLLNEARAEYLLGNFEECHNKLYKLLGIKLSNYEKFRILKHLCYDHNYYEALIVLDDLKKTYYYNKEIEPIERRIKIKLQVADEKLDEALKLWEAKKYNNSLSLYKEIISYFPAYKPAYLHYSLAMDSMGNYDEAYNNINVYYKLYKLYPDRQPEISEAEIKELIQELYTKIRGQIKEKTDK
ncbi:MAG TPA: tetratricopeptide repeat protein [Candidatus Gastranaerophilales bacterium]|nr:tetratricopeptide repeat protein [Candidatus Gastranaerophilales bacterium]